MAQAVAHPPAALRTRLLTRGKLLLKRYGVALALACASCAAFVYYIWDINSWKFAFVDDEWQFYTMARTIASENFRVNPLSMHGVYGFNGMLGSVYQAFFLKLFGANNAAWRLSNSVLIVPIGICFYLWLRDDFGRRTALLSTLILQASYFIANYLKIGYVNAQAFALYVAALYVASRCGRRLTGRNAAALGGLLGISFYVYIGPLFPLLVAPYLLPLVRSRSYMRWKLLRAAAICGGLYVALVLPGVLSLTSWSAAATKTSFSREYADNTQMLVKSEIVCKLV